MSMLYDILKSKLPSLRHDLVLPDYNIIIECNEHEHFSDETESSLHRQKLIHKMLCANEIGYSTIRILQQDLWFDRYDWLTVLLKQIEKIKASKEILNIFAS